MKSKNIFITGGTSGIGLSLAKLYISKNCNVAICGRDLSKIPNDLIDIIEAYQVDVTILEQVENALKSFQDKHKKIDLVIINAGISVGKKQATPNFQDSLKVTNTNVIGFLNTVHPSIDIMIKQKYGHIVAVSSVAGFVGLPGASSYSASKSYITKYCESLSIDMKSFNIDISVICPGFIDTPLTKRNDHSMPFIMNSEKAALLISNAIGNKKDLYIFPWQMKAVITLLNKMPRSLYRKLFNLKLFNYSK